ncbi:MAG: hypothetical protein FJ026_11980 [Chloroflexi bacterium]|nr:hypothetical protein [Chloroflexota bacterium]
MVHPAEFPREYSNEQDGLPFVRAGDVRDGQLNLTDLPFVSRDMLRSFPQSRLRVGDVLVVRTGAKAGEVAMFAEPEGEYYASSHTLLLRAKASVNPRYLEQFLVGRFGKEQILRRLTGAAQRQLQKPSVASIRVPLPPRPIQDAIAGKMDAAYRRKRELEAEAKALLESIDGYVLGELGTEWGKPPDRGRPVGHEAVWFDTWRRDVKRLDPKRYRYQREGPASKGLRRLGDLLTHRLEKVDRNKYTFEDLQLVSLHFDGTMSARDVKAWRKDIKGTLWFAYPEDLVYSKIDARNGAIGLVPDELGKVAVTSEYPVYRVKEGISADYLKIVLRTPQFTDLLKAMAAGHSGRKRVQPGELEDVLIPVPPLDQQRKIVTEEQARREQARALKDKAEQVVAEAKAEVERMILGEGEL